MELQRIKESKINGERVDSETGLQYLRARYYNPDLGRFITRDDYQGKDSTPASLNRYLYGKSNPIKWVDPSGRFPMSLSDLMVGLQVASTLFGLLGGSTITSVLFGSFALDGLPDSALSKISTPDASIIGASYVGGIGFFDVLAGIDILKPFNKSVLWLYPYIGMGTNLLPKIGIQSLHSFQGYVGMAYDIGENGNGYAGTGFSISVSLSILKRSKKFFNIIGKIPFNAVIYSAKRGGNGVYGTWGWLVSKSFSKTIDPSSGRDLSDFNFISFGMGLYWGPFELNLFNYIGNIENNLKNGNFHNYVPF